MADGEGGAWPWPTPVDDGEADHLTAGLRVPSVALLSTLDSAVDLSHLPGRVVLFIYPWTGRPGLPNPPGWDDIPGAHGSTPEAQRFSDLHAEFAALGVAVFGLSGQSTEDQAEFAGRMGLPFALLSDEVGTFRDALRLPTFVAGETSYLSRLTLVLRDGTVEHVFYPVHPPDRHAAAVLEVLRGA